MGESLTYKQWYAPTATHLALYFHPQHQPKTPVFYQKLSPKVLFFSHCPEFWKFFSQRPLIGWNLRKRYPNVPYFYGFCDWKTPYYFVLHTHGLFEGNVAPSTSQKLENFVFSKQNSCNLVNTFRCKFNTGDENKISVLQAQPTQLCIMD